MSQIKEQNINSETKLKGTNLLNKNIEHENLSFDENELNEQDNTYEVVKEENTKIKRKGKKVNKKLKKREHIRVIDDKFIKEAFSLISNTKTNFYQKLYTLAITPVEDWDHVAFLSSIKKIERFIEMTEREIDIAKSKKFNFQKYNTLIKYILCLHDDVSYPEVIMKNMYIAKLQNIVFLLKKDINDNDIKDVKEEKQDISR